MPEKKVDGPMKSYGCIITNHTTKCYNCHELFHRGQSAITTPGQKIVHYTCTTDGKTRSGQTFSMSCGACAEQLLAEHCVRVLETTHTELVIAHTKCCPCLDCNEHQCVCELPPLGLWYKTSSYNKYYFFICNLQSYYTNPCINATHRDIKI